MFQRFNCFPLRKCAQYLYYQQENKRLFGVFSRNIFVKTTQVFIATKICCAIVSPVKSSKMDVAEVQKALYEGDIAVLKLMDELKDFVQVVSEEYRNCLRKQIEITEKSQNQGLFSEVWDELPHYRTLADELLTELNNYHALFETLGKMAEIQFEVNSFRENISVRISERFKESQEVIRKEFEENKKLETQLLKLNCDTILMDFSKDSDQK